MSSECLRPGCRNEVDVIGVCLSCVNSQYKPKHHGVEVHTDAGTIHTSNVSEFKL